MGARRGLKLRVRRLLAVVAGCGVVCVVAAASAGAAVTGVAVQAVGSPRYVTGSDGRLHIEYDLVITNVLELPATLKSLVVHADRGSVLTLSGNALAAHTHALRNATPTMTIPGSSTVATLVDIKLPPSARQVPRRLSNQIDYTVAPGTVRTIIGSYTVNAPTLIVDPRAPALIAPPLWGSGWWASSACCAPDDHHRRALPASNGTYTMIETFAVDWVRIIDGAIWKGDGTKVTDFYGYGAPIHAVADGTVVWVHKGLPDAAFPPSPNDLSVQTSVDYGGNSVDERIGPGEYAYYAHMVPGSIRVSAGQHLRTGQVIGLLGFSGNTNLPHLHFGIQETSDPFSPSVPFVIDRFELQGTGSVIGEFPKVAVRGPSRQERRAYPLTDAVATFTP
jgi:Peptidase family M23